MLNRRCKKLIELYVDVNLHFTYVEKSNEVYYCQNKFGNDPDCNCAFVLNNKVDVDIIEKYYTNLNKNCVICNLNCKSFDISKKLINFNVHCKDVYLVANVNKLYNKYKKLHCPQSIGLEKIDIDNFEEFQKISYMGFSAVGADNPYSQVNLNEYYEALKFNLKNKNVDIFLINISGKNVGAFELSYAKNICYFAGLTILPQYRKRLAFFAMKLALDYIKDKKIKKILCITAKGGYPNKIYTKIGFKQVLSSCTYVKNKKPYC